MFQFHHLKLIAEIHSTRSNTWNTKNVLQKPRLFRLQTLRKRLPAKSHIVQTRDATSEDHDSARMLGSMVQWLGLMGYFTYL